MSPQGRTIARFVAGSLAISACAQSEVGELDPCRDLHAFEDGYDPDRDGSLGFSDISASVRKTHGASSHTLRGVRADSTGFVAAWALGVAIDAAGGLLVDAGLLERAGVGADLQAWSPLAGQWVPARVEARSQTLGLMRVRAELGLTAPVSFEALDPGPGSYGFAASGRNFLPSLDPVDPWAEPELEFGLIHVPAHAVDHWPIPFCAQRSQSGPVFDLRSSRWLGMAVGAIPVGEAAFQGILVPASHTLPLVAGPGDEFELTGTSGGELTTAVGGTTQGDELDPTTSGSDETSGDELCLHDGCKPWESSCGAGMKCSPRRCVDGCCVDSTQCVEQTGNRQIGQDCFRIETRQTDNCDAGLFCMPHEGASGGGGPGRCEPVCDPGREDICSEFGIDDAVCVRVSGTRLPLCRRTCDPLGDGCGEAGRACHWADSHFVCTRVTGPTGIGSEGGAVGEACEVATGCQAGTVCAPREFQPECRSVESCSDSGSCGCCLELCDPMASVACAPPGDCREIEGTDVGVCVSEDSREHE